MHRLWNGMPAAKPDDIIISQAGEKGEGVFATNAIFKGMIICEYVGKLISEHDSKALGAGLWPPPVEQVTPKGNFSMFFKTLDGKRWCLDAVDSDGPGRKINHSIKCQNVRPIVLRKNRGSKPEVYFKALRDVEPGEELLYDYGEFCHEAVSSNPWLAT